MKRIVIATMLSTALLAAPVVQAASNQDRAMATGAVVGATAGGMIGSGHNQALQGAIFGAVLGTIAGAVIASNSQPVYVEERTHHQPQVKHYRKTAKRHKTVAHRHKTSAGHHKHRAKRSHASGRQFAVAYPQHRSSVRYASYRRHGHNDEHDDRD